MRLGLRVRQADELALLLPQLPPGWRVAQTPVVERLFSVVVGGAGARGRRFHLLYEDHVRVGRTHDPASLLETLGARIRLYVATHARRRVFVHAGVVGWQGRAIIIPGRSFSGKSSLVAALVRAGATYYSDEFAVLDAQGRVHPYAKPLSLRAPGTQQQTDVSVETLGGRAGTRPLPVGRVIVTEYRAGGRWRPRPLSQGQGALALLAHVVAARQQPAAALTALAQVVAGAPVWQGRRGEAAETARAILYAPAD